MFKFRFNHITLLMTAMILSGCATSTDLRDPANDDSEVQQMMLNNQIEEERMVQEQSSVLVPQDMEVISLKERSEREELKNFENELGNENNETRLPANDAVDEKINLNEKPQAAPTSQNTQTKYEAAELSKEELTQQLFDADSVIVQKGDSLSGIAERHLGNKYAWKKIWALNPNLHNPDIINVGEKVFVPRGDFSRKVASTNDQQHLAPKVVAKASTKAKKEKAVKTVKKFITEPVPQAIKEPDAPPPPAPNKEDMNVIEGAVIFPANSLDVAAQTNEELLKEHLDLKTYIKNKGKVNEDVIGGTRKTASVDEAGVASEETKAINLPKNLTKIISIVGFLLLLTVLAGFFFSKPYKNT